MAAIARQKMEKRAWLMIIIAWAAVLLTNLANFSLGMMLPSMRDELGFSIESAGYLSSTAWIVKAIVTIPIALLVARINPKYLLGSIYALVGASLLLHGFAQNLTMIYIGRALVSAASAGVLAPLVTVKINWVPQEKITQINGIENCIGPIGQSLGTAAVTWLLAVFSGWRGVMIAMGVVSFIIAAFWFICYREKPGLEFQKSDLPFIEPLKDALRYKPVWLLAFGWPGTSLIWIAIYTFWPTYAIETLGLSMEQAGLVLGLLPIASAIASFVSPKITEWIGYDKLMIWPWGFILPLVYFGMLKSSNVVVLSIFSFIAGFGAYAFVPIAMSSLYKIPNIKPRTVSLGVSCILTMVGIGGALGGSLAGIMGETMGLYKAMAYCCLSPLIFGVLTLFLPETGRKNAEKLAAQAAQKK